MSGKFDTRRFAAVALLAVLLLGSLIWIGWASLAVSAVGEQAVQQRGQLDALIERSRDLTDKVAEGRAVGLDVYFPGDTQAIAGASVQRVVDGIVDKAGGRVVESQILPVDEAGESANRIDLKATFEADIKALQAALFDIETHLPIMMVRSMSVRSFVTRGSGVTDEENPVLQVALVISGYWKAEEQ